MGSANADCVYFSNIIRLYADSFIYIRMVHVHMYYRNKRAHLLGRNRIHFTLFIFRLCPISTATNSETDGPTKTMVLVVSSHLGGHIDIC